MFRWQPHRSELVNKASNRACASLRTSEGSEIVVFYAGVELSSPPEWHGRQNLCGPRLANAVVISIWRSGFIGSWMAGFFPQQICLDIYYNSYSFLMQQYLLPRQIVSKIISIERCFNIVEVNSNNLHSTHSHEMTRLLVRFNKIHPWMQIKLQKKLIFI